jgi:hypothetical protein
VIQGKDRVVEVLTKVSRTLPANYQEQPRPEFTPGLAFILNAGAVVLFVVFGLFFCGTALWLRPETLRALLGVLLSGVVLVVPGALALSVATVVLHELVHGAAFWLITRERPLYGRNGLYAYATMPGWYMPRNHYLAVALAPAVLLSLLGLLLLPLVPTPLLPILVFVLTMNAGGASSDFLGSLWLLQHPATLVVLETEESMRIYDVVGTR